MSLFKRLAPSQEELLTPLFFFLKMKGSSIPRDWISFFLLELMLADKPMQDAIPIFCDVLKNISQYSNRSIPTLFALFLKMQIGIMEELYPRLPEITGLDSQSILNRILSRIIRNGSCNENENENMNENENENENENGNENNNDHDSDSENGIHNSDSNNNNNNNNNEIKSQNIAVSTLKKKNDQCIDPVYMRSYFSSFIYMNISDEEFGLLLRKWIESQSLAIDLFVLGHSDPLHHRIQKLEYYLGISSFKEKEIIPLVMNHINDNNDRLLSYRQALAVFDSSESSLVVLGSIFPH